MDKTYRIQYQGVIEIMAASEDEAKRVAAANCTLTNCEVIHVDDPNQQELPFDAEANNVPSSKM